jgi:pyruvate/2-oxoglutarate dehydrogenase complex dihydrolipoamide acyltransferase (E2) component
MRTSVSGLVVLLCILTAAPRAVAQSQGTSHAAPPAAIDQALQQHVTAVDADRAVVQRLLARPDVKALAAEMGLDLRSAQTAVATIDGEQLSDLASQARQAEQELAGGQGSVRISTTLIIIALLVVILLIVAID